MKITMCSALLGAKMQNKSLTAFDYIQIAKKCRKQLAHAQGMKAALSLLNQGYNNLAVWERADNAVRSYTARLNEVQSILAQLNAEMMEDDDA